MPPCSLPLLPLPCKVCLTFFLGFKGIAYLFDAPLKASRPVLPDQPAPSPQHRFRAARYFNESLPCQLTSQCRLFASSDEDWLRSFSPDSERAEEVVATVRYRSFNSSPGFGRGAVSASRPLSPRRRSPVRKGAGSPRLRTPLPTGGEGAGRPRPTAP